MSRVDNRTKPRDVDEDEIRDAFLKGERPSNIAARYGHQAQVVANMISYQKQKWMEEARLSRITSDDRRTIIRKRIFESGGSYIAAISVPRITMHVLALQEARR